MTRAQDAISDLPSGRPQLIAAAFAFALAGVALLPFYPGSHYDAALPVPFAIAFFSWGLFREARINKYTTQAKIAELSGD